MSTKRSPRALVTSVLRTMSPHWPVWAVAAWGAVLRIFYFAITPFHIRAYDTGAHVQYIIEVVRTFQLPAIGSSWESHQPPLYYFLAAGWVKIGLLLGRTTEALSHDVRILSLFFSFATLALCAWIALIIFPKKSDRMQAAVFLLVPAILPGIVYFTSRISNDTLVLPLSLLWLAFFLKWKKTGNENAWFFSSLALGFAALTKMSVVPLIPVMCLEVLLMKGAKTKEKMKLLVIAGASVAIIAGWNVFLRTFGAYADFLVLKGVDSSNLNPILMMKRNVLNYLSFNPFMILQTPFANPWKPGPARDGFWEYFFRSAFTGEWTFGDTIWLNRIILALAIAALPVALFGARKMIQDRFVYGRILLATVISLGVFLVVFQIRFPCACLQDFRYVPLIPIIFGAFFAYALGKMPTKLAALCRHCAFLLAGLCTAFVISLAFLS